MSAKNRGKRADPLPPSIEPSDELWAVKDWESFDLSPWTTKDHLVSTYIHEMTFQLATLAKNNGDFELSDRLLGALKLERPAKN